MGLPRTDWFGLALTRWVVQFGRVVGVSVPWDHYARRNRGFAFITFAVIRNVLFLKIILIHAIVDGRNRRRRVHAAILYDSATPGTWFSICMSLGFSSRHAPG